MTAESFAPRFRRLRESAGLTRTALARPRYTVSYVSQIEAARRVPASEALAFFAGRLGVTAEFLATGRPEGLRDRVAYEIERARQALRGSPADAHERATALLDEVDRFGLEELRGRALVTMADALLFLRRHREAIDTYEQGLETETLTERERGLATSALARAYRTVGDLSYAADLVESYLRPSRGRPIEPAVAADLYAVLVSIFFERGDVHRAQRMAERALAAVEMGVSPSVRANVLWTASRVFAESRHYTEALDLAMRARTIIEDLDDQQRLAMVHNATAFLCLEAEPPRIGDAQRHLDVAEDLLGAHAAGPDLASIHAERSRLALVEDRPADALRYSEMALAGLGADELARGRCLFLRGRALAKLGRGAAAADAFEDAAAVFQKTGSRQQEASCWREIGELKLASGDVSAAVESLRAGLEALEPKRSRA